LMCEPWSKDAEMGTDHS